MRILCEGCGKEIEEGKAILRKWMEENIYFCSTDCEKKHQLLREAESEDDEPEPGPSE